MKNYILEITRRKDLVKHLIISGLKAQHRNTLLGYFWWLLDPLLSVFIYYFLVVVVMGRGGPDYPAFLVTGLMVFRWLRSTMSGSAKAITKNANIITQVYMPKAIFPIAESFTQLINFMFGLIIMAVFLIFYQIRPGVEIIWLPFIMLVQMLFHIAIAMLLSYICVFIKDIENFITYFMRVMRYASPVIWEADRLPQQYQWIATANPLSHLLVSYRNIIMYGKPPEVQQLLVLGFFSLAAIGFLTYYYSKNEHKLIKAL